MTHGTDAALDTRPVVNPTQCGRNHVAVFESTGEFLSLAGIVPNPVEQLREAPLRGIHASAPLDGLQLLPVRELGNLSGFPFCAVVAPEIVVVKREQIRGHW